MYDILTLNTVEKRQNKLFCVYQKHFTCYIYYIPMSGMKRTAKTIPKLFHEQAICGRSTKKKGLLD